MTLMKASEIFTPTKLPDITFVDDHLHEKTKILRQSLDMGATVISLSGPSKSGKTVFIEKTLGRENLVQVTGAGIDKPKKLWDRVFDLIGTPTSGKITGTTGFIGTLAAKASGGVPLVVAGEVSSSGAWSNNEASQFDYAPDYLQLLIKELGGSDFVIFIDDFHYISKDIQTEIANQIKEAVRGGVKFICASVPYHSDDVIRANPDLRGRIVNLDFNYWDSNELKKIAERGFSAMNIVYPPAIIEAFAAEAAGSPQLMQSLCLNSCYEIDAVVSLNDPKTYSVGILHIEKVCERTALTADYSSTVGKMQDGPKTRGTDRKSYLLSDNSITDVYPLILKAIALNPPELTIRYANLLARIGKLVSNESPSGSSLIGACTHMSDIANDAENKIIVEWDASADVLDIRDPYLLFYLRWADLK